MKIDGKKIADEILNNLKTKVRDLKKKNIAPHLAIIIVGNDPASASYIKQKELKAKEIGITTTIIRLLDNVSEDKLLEAIEQLNNDGNTHGIIVQQPLPQNINIKNVTRAIDPKKDVDGFHPNSHFQMPIAMSVLKILEEVYVAIPNIQSRFADWLKSKNIVVIGKGKTGGKPIIQMLGNMKIPFALIDSKTKKPEALIKTADILISAVGKENVIKSKMIRRGVVLIGIGISREKSAKVMGDYDQNEIGNIASFYTPTPGGIGPVNVAMLLRNTATAASR